MRLAYLAERSELGARKGVRWARALAEREHKDLSLNAWHPYYDKKQSTAMYTWKPSAGEEGKMGGSLHLQAAGVTGKRQVPGSAKDTVSRK